MRFSCAPILALIEKGWFITATFTPGPDHFQIAMKKMAVELAPGATAELQAMIKDGVFIAVTDFCDKPETKETVFTLELAPPSKSDSSEE